MTKGTIFCTWCTQCWALAQEYSRIWHRFYRLRHGFKFSTLKWICNWGDRVSRDDAYETFIRKNWVEHPICAKDDWKSAKYCWTLQNNLKFWKVSSALIINLDLQIKKSMAFTTYATEVHIPISNLLLRYKSYMLHGDEESKNDFILLGGQVFAIVEYFWFQNVRILKLATGANSAHLNLGLNAWSSHQSCFFCLNSLGRTFFLEIWDICLFKVFNIMSRISSDWSICLTLCGLVRLQINFRFWNSEVPKLRNFRLHERGLYEKY